MKKLCILWVLLSVATQLFAKIEPTEADKKRCYMEGDNKEITFVYDLKTWGQTKSQIHSLVVIGSFNDWQQRPEFSLTYQEERNLFYLTCPYDKINRPGNSGQPEYKFAVNDSSVSAPLGVMDDYVFMNADRNRMVVFQSDDFAQIKANSITANTIKQLKDFDLEHSGEAQAAISNFRRVPGTSCLFRSYHPYYPSRPTYETEQARLQWISTFADDGYHIQSDICLTDNYADKGVPIPAWYKRIMERDAVLYVGTNQQINPDNEVPSYNEVYYHIRGSLFAGWMKEVVRFIVDETHQAPFLIHCAIGTDRTGVFSATLAALCGASWKEIRTDYQLSNRMGIREFRDYHLLQYAMEDMLQVPDINQVKNLQEAVRDYFIQQGILTQEEIKALVNRLTGDVLVTEAHLLTDVCLNPTSGVVSMPGMEDGEQVQVVSMDGKVVKTIQVALAQVDLSDIPAGMYVLCVSDGEYARVQIK